MGIRFRGSELLVIGALTAFSAWYVNDLLGGWAVLAAYAIVKLTWTDDRLPVLPAAMLYQWMQVTIGIFYAAATGHTVPTHAIDYRPMVEVGLTFLVVIALGLRVGIYLVRPEHSDNEERPVRLLSNVTLFAAYLLSVLSEGWLLSLTADYPSLRQILITFTVARLGLLFLLMRRQCHPVFKPHLLLPLLGFEIVLGLTGYFANFKDPLAMAAIVVGEVFDHKNKTHWITAVVVSALGAVLAVMWMGVRSDVRRALDQQDPLLATRTDRLRRVNSLATEFFNSEQSQLVNTTDQLIDRMWAVYYPALAMQRVPRLLPHTNGTILRDALVHVVTPRVFFPEKKDLASDSEMVRKYAGVFVAGSETGTSIAFGYVAESYIDFGIPAMFIPPFLFGLGMGAIYAWFLRTIWHRELAVAVVIVVMWLSLYLFERSWANVLGMSMSLIVYLGLPITILDRFLVTRQMKIDERERAQRAFELHLQANQR